MVCTRYGILGLYSGSTRAHTPVYRSKKTECTQICGYITVQLSVPGYIPEYITIQPSIPVYISECEQNSKVWYHAKHKVGCFL